MAKRLSTAQSIKIVDWLRANHRKLQEDKCDRTQVVARLKQEHPDLAVAPQRIGFYIQSAGIDFKPVIHRTYTNHSKVPAVLAELCDLVEQIATVLEIEVPHLVREHAKDGREAKRVQGNGSH